MKIIINLILIMMICNLFFLINITIKAYKELKEMTKK